MKFFLKKKFFIEVFLGFVMFGVITGFQMLINPDRASDIFWNSVLTSILMFVVISIPWYMAAHSSIVESGKQLQEIRGGIEHLRKQRPGVQDEQKLRDINEKIRKAVGLYNQQVEITDRALGEYPSRFFVERIFRYRRPRDLNPEL